MPLHVSSTCAHHQEVNIALHSLWYTIGCVIQFWSPDDEHMCSKHVEAWNKLILKQKFCASSWLITEINILRCTVSKTSKHCIMSLYVLFFCHYYACWYNAVCCHVTSLIHSSLVVSLWNTFAVSLSLLLLCLANTLYCNSYLMRNLKIINWTRH